MRRRSQLQHCADGGPFALFKIAVTGGKATPLFTPPAGFAATRPDWSSNEDLASGQIAFAYTDVAETFSELWLSIRTARRR